MAHTLKKKPATKSLTTRLRPVYPWIIGGAVGIAALAWLALILSRATPEVPPAPVLVSAKTDLKLLTRMLGDVTLDTGATAAIPEKLGPEFARVKTATAQRDWQQAAGLLKKLLPRLSGQAVMLAHDWRGFCFYQAASPDLALAEFRQALSAETDAGLAARAGFNIGYLFQSRGFSDSAADYYAAAQPLVARAAPELLPELLNNLGLARERLADSSRALDSYLAAAQFIDTAADDPSSRVLRDNVRRLKRP